VQQFCTLGSVRGEVTAGYGLSYSGTQPETADTAKDRPKGRPWLLLLGGLLKCLPRLLDIGNQDVRSDASTGA
jgi:hypothetical protein